MFQLTDDQLASIKGEIAKLKSGGQDAAAQAWLVWAEMYIAEVNVPGPQVESVKKLMPLLVWLSTEMKQDPAKIHSVIRESILRIMFKAKLEDRELSVEDGHRAILIVRNHFSPADG